MKNKWILLIFSVIAAGVVLLAQGCGKTDGNAPGSTIYGSIS